MEFSTIEAAQRARFEGTCLTIFESANVPLIRDALEQLASIFEYYSLPISEDQWTQTDGGNALSPSEAKKCLLDFNRTIIFLRGLEAAIKEVQKRFPGEKIHILYAGTGPYATLALPITTRFNKNEIAFTAIDIHQQSLENAENIADSLGLSEYFLKFEKADATKYKGRETPHIIVSETMDIALCREPQAAITHNLKPTLQKGGLFVPEDVIISAHAGSAQLGILTTLMDAADTNQRSVTAELQLPEDACDEGTRIETRIVVHRGFVVEPDTCDITSSIPLGISAGKTNIRIAYQLGEPTNRITATTY